MTTLYVGIDPDLHNTGIGIVNDDGLPVAGHCLKVSSKLKGPDAVKAMAYELVRFFSRGFTVDGIFGVLVAIESQEIAYTAKSGKNPRDILHLGWVTGAATGAAWSDFRVDDLTLFRPQQWKGSTPKQIHHGRICTALGWADFDKKGTKKDGYCVPRKPILANGKELGLLTGQYKHVMDGFGLALKLREVRLAEQRKQNALASARK